MNTCAVKQVKNLKAQKVETNLIISAPRAWEPIGRGGGCAGLATESAHLPMWDEGQGSQDLVCPLRCLSPGSLSGVCAQNSPLLTTLQSRGAEEPEVFLQQQEPQLLPMLSA